MTAEGPGAGATPARGEPRGAQRNRRRALAVLGLVVVAGAVAVWLLVGRGGGEPARPPTRATAAGVSPQRLNAIAAGIPHPVYWVGARPKNAYEFTQTKDGRIYIRYLPPGTKVGSARGDFLTVGTYPLQQAFDTLRATARKQRAATIRLDDGGLAFQDKNRPTSVYAAYPGSDFEIEVFEPSGGQAMELVRGGKLAPLVKPSSRAASVADLRALAAGLGHRIYWAGPARNRTYELTTTKDRRVYIRYLPPGVQPGARGANYVTVGTYPQPNAFTLLKATAAKLQATPIKLPGGGLAYIDTSRPTSAYLAYPDHDLQVEVYTPDPAETERLLTSREIVPVR
jgi:hypothetical protein